MSIATNAQVLLHDTNRHVEHNDRRDRMIIFEDLREKIVVASGIRFHIFTNMWELVL